MKLKKLLSICLVGVMAATLLTACGSSDETVGEEIKDDAEEVVEDVKDVAEDIGEGVEDAVEDVGEDVKDAAEEAVEDVKDNAEEEESGGSFEGFQETITVKTVGLTLFGDEGTDEVIDAVNEISESEINVVLDYTAMDIATFMEQVGLMLAGGERIDLLMVTGVDGVDFTTMQSQNMLMDISGYLDEYAPDMLALVGDYLSATTVNGVIYAVPNYRIYNSNQYLVMRKDILDYLDLTEQAEAISSWSDFEDIMLQVQAAQDELPEELKTTAMICGQSEGSIICSPYCNVGTDEFSGHYGYDNLGDSSRKLIEATEDGQIINHYKNEDYRESIEIVRNWYEEGLVYKDSATTSENGDSLMSDGVVFAFCSGSEIGIEASKRDSTGYDVVCVVTSSLPIQTSNGAQWGWCVPVTSEEPEAAIAFLNLLYTNADIVNLFVYGIEGRDYVLNEDGEACILEDCVYQSSDWLFGNQFLAYPKEGQGGDFREISLENMLSAEISPYYGFTVDTDPISLEITAIYNVIEKYRPGLESGTTDPSLLDDMIEDLDDAGAQTVIDYYQECLDEWLAEQ